VAGVLEGLQDVGFDGRIRWLFSLPHVGDRAIFDHDGVVPLARPGDFGDTFFDVTPKVVLGCSNSIWQRLTVDVIGWEAVRVRRSILVADEYDALFRAGSRKGDGAGLGRYLRSSARRNTTP